MYCNAFISAPDVTVQSLGDIDGQRLGDSEILGPLFYAEAEQRNRSLLELIHHLGMLLADFPNLNGVLGSMGEEDDDGNKVNVLILIEWRTVAGVRQPHVTQLVAFGPHPYTDTNLSNANVTYSTETVNVQMPRLISTDYRCKIVYGLSDDKSVSFLERIGDAAS
jgi:hypothetical protein